MRSDAITIYDIKARVVVSSRGLNNPQISAVSHDSHPAQGPRRHKCPQTLKASVGLGLADPWVDVSVWLDI